MAAAGLRICAEPGGEILSPGSHSRLVHLGWKLWVGIAALVLSTVLNALYYLPTVSLLFGRRSDSCFADEKPQRDAAYLIALAAFVVLNFLLGTCSEPVTKIIETGLSVLS